MALQSTLARSQTAGDTRVKSITVVYTRDQNGPKYAREDLGRAPTYDRRGMRTVGCRERFLGALLVLEA